MLFSSIPFLYAFLPLVLALYFAVPKKVKNTVLLLASLVFYFYGERGYVLLLLFSSACDYIIGLIMEKHRGTPKAKAALFVSITINLLVLGFFKYADFILENLNLILQTDIPPLHIHLPLGISFFTFQTMSYAVDVYRGDVKAERNPLGFAMYVSMFPQLVAGPIVRYNTVAAELKERSHSFENFAYGVNRFLIGLGKKVLIANTLGDLSRLMMDSSAPSVLSHWLAIVAFTLQIYFDFSGYSDMAIGLGRFFGFRFLENFNYPFIAKSISDFWRRWHMSMGTWFREYLYIPLGGNRGGKAKWIRNIFIVWFCTGLWHGANWNFIVWGLYFGILLTLEKLVWGKALERIPAVLQHVYTLVLTFFSFVIFHIEDMADMITHLGVMFGAGGLPMATTETLYYLRSFAPMLAAAVIGSTPLLKNLAGRLRAHPTLGKLTMVLEPVFHAALLIVVTGYLIDSSFNPFLYFRF